MGRRDGGHTGAPRRKGIGELLTRTLLDGASASAACDASGSRSSSRMRPRSPSTQGSGSSTCARSQCGGWTRHLPAPTVADVDLEARRSNRWPHRRKFRGNATRRRSPTCARSDRSSPQSGAAQGVPSTPRRGARLAVAARRDHRGGRRRIATRAVRSGCIVGAVAERARSRASLPTSCGARRDAARASARARGRPRLTAPEAVQPTRGAVSSARNPTRLWVASQNGFVAECPHRQSSDRRALRAARTPAPRSRRS